MATRNHNWYDLQAGRRYPLDETSTGEDDQGNTIRDDILVDCHLRFPRALGAYAFVQGITVAPNMVTIVIGAVETPTATTTTTIAAVSVPRPVAINTHYDIQGVLPGVAGWLVFGPGASAEFIGRYSTPAQSLLAPRCARPYRAAPVPTLGKENLATALQGIVKLAAQAPLTATYEINEIDGVETPTIVFRLEGEIQGQNPLSYFLGPCGQRPESGTCPKPPLETINGVSPDCNGNITLEFDGFDAYEMRENIERRGRPAIIWACDGIDVIGSLGLSEACNQGVPQSRRRYVDKCNSESASDDAYWYNPVPAVPGQPPPPPDITSSLSLPSLAYSSSCAILPVCVNFEAGSAPTFDPIAGLFVFEQRLAPRACPASAEDTQHYTYAAANIVGTNLSLYKNCAHRLWADDHTIVTELLLTADGLNKNGGLILNYLPGYEPLRIPTTYLAAVLDADRSALRLLRYNGSQFVVEYSAPFLTYPGKWYELSARADITGTAAVVTVTAFALDGSVAPLSFSVPVAKFGNPIGQVGLFSNRAYTNFNSFHILET